MGAKMCCVTSGVTGNQHADLRDKPSKGRSNSKTGNDNFLSIASVTSNTNTFKENPPMPEYQVVRKDSLG